PTGSRGLPARRDGDDPEGLFPGTAPGVDAGRRLGDRRRSPPGGRGASREPGSGAGPASALRVAPGPVRLLSSAAGQRLPSWIGTRKMITGRDFLKQAQPWISLATEPDWRSAVSRAYYAAFHEARRMLSDLGFVVPRGDRAHAYLWRRLSNCGDIQVQLA